MNSATVAHRWANKDFGRNNTLTASRSCHAEGRNYFSYYTVFGQWVDIANNVVVIYTGSTTSTSSKYKLYKRDFPKDVHVFPYDDGGHSYYHGCNLISSYTFKDEDFTTSRKIVLLDYFVQQMYNQFENITTSKSKGAENVSFEMWGYFEELCSIYKDISVAKYLKTLKKVKCKKEAFKSEKEYAKKYNAAIDKKKVMVKLLAAGVRDVQKITDAMFGACTYQKYMDYCARFRKAADKRAKVEALCNRLGIRSPYEKWGGYKVLDHEMSADDIRKLSAKERLDLHFKALAYKEYKEHEKEREEKYNKNFRNAYRWIVGYEPKVESTWSGRLSKNVKKVRNMWTGDEYIVGEVSYRSHIKLWGLKLDVTFDYDEFRKASDKEEWIRNFYADSIEVDRNRHALSIFDRFGDAVYTDQLIDYSMYRVYVINDVLREGASEKELKICEDFVNSWNAILHDKETRYRAEQIERERRKEEERKEKEYQAKVKQEQIDECVERGMEGYRDLWRLHLVDVDNAYKLTDESDVFFYGGNVLLRFNLDKTVVETSKGISIPIAVCKKFYPIFKGWHENPKTFKSMKIETKLSGTYTISEYKNDILTAGCHDIAWTEMERMWNEIEKLNGAAV